MCNAFFSLLRTLMVITKAHPPRLLLLLMDKTMTTLRPSKTLLVLLICV